jgi:hypothetical protein
MGICMDNSCHAGSHCCHYLLFGKNEKEGNGEKQNEKENALDWII